MIAEDSVLLREGLTRLLVDAGLEVIARVGDGDALVAAVDREQPDVAIVDVRMPPTQTDEGLHAALELRRRHPEVAILVLSQHVEERYAADLVQAGGGGIGYLLKERVADVNEFLEAVQRVAAGGTAFDREVVAQIFGRRSHDEPLATLSPRERDVLALMAEGRSNHAVGAALYLSAGAVEKHIASIFRKLHLLPDENENRRVLAVLAYLQRKD